MGDRNSLLSSRKPSGSAIMTNTSTCAAESVGRGDVGRQKLLAVEREAERVGDHDKHFHLRGSAQVHNRRFIWMATWADTDGHVGGYGWARGRIRMGAWADMVGAMRYGAGSSMLSGLVARKEGGIARVAARNTHTATPLGSWPALRGWACP
eukprot:365065-Chlamydomonas_euryale.AAC.10